MAALKSLKDVGKNTPAVEVLRRVLEQHGGPMSIQELAVNVLNVWGRDFPNTPYETVALVYKLATRVLDCKVYLDDVEGGEVIIHREETGESIPLSPELGPDDLNSVAESLRLVKVALPELSVAG